MATDYQAMQVQPLILHDRKFSGTTDTATIAAPPSPYQGEGSQQADHHDFKVVVGSIPYKAPNVRIDHEEEDLMTQINRGGVPTTWVDTCCSAVCCLSGIGALWVCCKMKLINQGEFGFSLDNGRPFLLPPGRHFLSSPINSFARTVQARDDIIEVGPVSIIRVPQGSFGFGTNDGAPEVLTPGRHVRNNASFKFREIKSLSEDLVQFGPIKLLTVKSGGVRVCYDRGRVQIFPEGRYAINSATFQVGGYIHTQQQNVRFDGHPVLLDGGINMLVEGLLTYQVVDVERLVRQLGEGDLLRSIKDVTKAELSRVFSSVHLEQLATAQVPTITEEKGPSSLLGSDVRPEGECRGRICAEVMKDISPIASSWGVKIINFQLESTKIADIKYAHEYEEASLALAKAKANRRAVDAENEVKLQKAAATAKAFQIEAEGKKNAVILEAEGEAQARRIDAKARNEAAEMMKDKFARDFAMSGQNVEFARGLKAKVLTVLPNSSVGSQMLSGGPGIWGGFGAATGGGADLTDRKERKAE